MKVFGKNKFLGLGLVLTLIIALSVGCMPDREGMTKDGGSNEASSAEEKTPTNTEGELEEETAVPVETLTLTSDDIAETVYTYGYLETKDTYIVTPNSGGIVDEILVSTGDYIELGTLLYQLEGEDLELSQERDMLSQNSSVASAKNNRDSLSVTLAQRQSDVDAMSLSLSTAQKNYDSTLTLYESSIVSKAELDGTISSLEQTQISYDQALLNLESTQLSYNAAKTSYSDALQNYELTEEDYDGRKDDLLVTAPITGLVTDVSVQEGMMNSGSLGVTIVDDTTMLLNINVMEKYIYDIEVGQSVDLTLEYEGKSITGYVTEISLSGQNGYYPVEISIDNADKSLSTGMFIEGYINTNIKTNVLKVEKTVLVQDINGNNYVFTIDEETNTAVKVPVTKGVEEGLYVEISGPIKSGDKIVVVGQDYITDQQEVLVVN